jgi:hypothetical protein
MFVTLIEIIVIATFVTIMSALIVHKFTKNDEDMSSAPNMEVDDDLTF